MNGELSTVHRRPSTRQLRHQFWCQSDSQTVRMSDPLMLAMSQSGIIETEFPDSHQIVPVKPVKMSTVVLPKRVLQGLTNVNPQRIMLTGKWKEESGVSPTIIRLKRPGPGELQGNPKRLKVTMNNNQHTPAEYGLMEPRSFGMMEPVLSRIFGGTFDTSAAFNVQVCLVVLHD